MSTKEQEVGGPGTALTRSEREAEGTREEGKVVTQTAIAARQEIELLRVAGGAAVEKAKLVRAVARMISGMEWGNVKGWDFSEGTQTAIARICVNYDADPALHIHILSGTIFLNAAYWTGELNAAIQNGTVRTWRQENISPRFAAAMRKQAETAIADAEKFKDEQGRTDGLRMLACARYADAACAYHEIPEAVLKNQAAAIFETIVEFTSDRDPVREANYAPNKVPGDPVGIARPGETAKTRSLRRAAIKALPKMRTKEEAAARDGVASEWALLQEEKKGAQQQVAQLAAGPQAVATGGEPSAAPAEGAKPLPVEPAAPAKPAFDKKDAQRGYMAQLRDAGVADRKAFQKANGFPESTADFTEADYVRAREIMTAPVRDAVLARVKERGIDLKDMARALLGKDAPVWIVDFKVIQAKLDEIEAEEAEGSEP